AWRPLRSDRAGLLFNYTHRDVSQTGESGTTSGAGTRDRADVLSTDGYVQPTKDLELYGRFALKYGDNTTPDLSRVAAFTYMMQARAMYHLGEQFDAAVEVRRLAQPSTFTSRTSYGAEVGYWVLSDLRLGVGYNFTGASEPAGTTQVNAKRGFYFTISSKLSNLFDLFGTSREGLTASEQEDSNKNNAEPRPQP
ncbi:MAG: hypothetical protein ACRD68_01610, partial [Pyrinomonadaceae bacterium]